MLLTVAIEAQARTSPAVPELAIVGEGGGHVSCSRSTTARPGECKVRAGLRQNGLVEIVEGLRPGQRVVTEGVVKIADGQNGAHRGRG